MDYIKQFKHVLIALAFIVVSIVGYKVYSDMSESLSCVFSDCKKDMVKTISDQKATIEKLEKALAESEKTLKELKENKNDNITAVKELCDENTEISGRVKDIIEKAKKDSQGKEIQQMSKKLLVKKPIVQENVESKTASIPEAEVVETKPYRSEFTAEAIITGLWDMHCGGKHNVCEKVS
jgi:membrane-associated HD superfamily phosphohydrolase